MYRLTEMIDVNANKQKVLATDFLYRDVIQHWHLAHQKCRNFIGRELELTVGTCGTNTQLHGS